MTDINHYMHKIKRTLTEPSVVYESVFAVMGAVLIAAAFFIQIWLEDTSWVVRTVFALSFIVGGYFKAYEGISKTIKNKVLNVEILMILAALGAFSTGNFSEGAILILIFSMSGALETFTTAKSEKALTALLNLAPMEATLLKDGQETIVSVSALKVGDVVSVKVGEAIPVDGIIVQGITSINEASITGESIPVEKKEADVVFASTLNEQSVIHVRTEKDPSESTVQKIIDFVRTAQEDQPKSQTVVDTVESTYVYVVIAMAITFMVVPPLFNWLTWGDAFYRGIIVLVVGSPCALVASISPAILSSLSKASRKKILIKGGSRLEGLNKTKVVLFDKTGTLTYGVPTVQTVYFNQDITPENILPIVKAMEADSTHPLAKAIVKYLEDVPSKNMRSKEIPGRGLEATFDGRLYQVGRFEGTESSLLKKAVTHSMTYGESIVKIYQDHTVVGFFGCADSVRDEAQELIQALKDRGIKTVMITGDHPVTADVIAASIGIEYVHSECFPEDKVTFVKEYKAKYGHVMMLGDGINDAPALSLADVAISMGSGTDVSLETSDIVLINNDLTSIIDTLDISKKTQRIIWQNVVFSIGVILFLLSVNVFGLIVLPLGVIFHEGSTILVILNSLRLIV